MHGTKYVSVYEELRKQSKFRGQRYQKNEMSWHHSQWPDPTKSIFQCQVKLFQENPHERPSPQAKDMITRKHTEN